MFSVRLFRLLTILTLAALGRKILFSPLENNIHTFAPPCNILNIVFNSLQVWNFDNARTTVSELLSLVLDLSMVLKRGCIDHVLAKGGVSRASVL